MNQAMGNDQHMRVGESDSAVRSQWKRTLALAFAISSTVFVGMGVLTTTISVMVHGELSSSGSATADGMLQMAYLCRLTMPIAGIALAVVGIACAFGSVLQRSFSAERPGYFLWVFEVIATGGAIMAANLQWLI